MPISLYETRHPINDKLCIRVPTIGEIIENEDAYYGAISFLVATPYDMMAQLDDAGIDFTQVDGWSLFCMLFDFLATLDLSMVFDNFKLSDFRRNINESSGEMFFVNEESGAVIDRLIHKSICDYLRQLLNIEDTSYKRPANEEARKYLLEKARKKLKRKSKPTRQSQLESFIVTLVNSSEFPYDYQSVLGLTICQFQASLKQVIKRVQYDKTMIGVYAGTINTKEIDQKSLSWISE